MVGFIPAHLFRRHVPDGSKDDPRRRSPSPRGSLRVVFGERAFDFGEPEVEDLDQTVFGQKEIVRLEIPVDDPFAVRRTETAADLNGEVDGFAGRQRSLVEPVTQRLPSRSSVTM